ncbi:MAG: M20/M25/M40 family metallo-hydrolase [Gammaproteobacteria bacterium]|nr:M20/M25/M40 family metallo-hydrolase [Gammaproteobacteria bacterium]
MMNIAKSVLVGVCLVSLGFSAQASEYPGPFHEKAVELLRTSVAMRTAEGFGLVPELASYLAAEMQQAGFDAQDIHLLPMGKTAALVIRYPGDGSSGKKPILLSAHMDVVNALPQDWNRDPFRLIEEDGYYFGRGSSDNKFGMAVLMATLMRLKAEGFVPNRDLVLALSGDEETYMETTRRLATDYRHLTDAEFALVADGGGGRLDEVTGEAVYFSVDVAEKTYATFEMTARNAGGHSSLPRADNAIKDLTQALTKIFDFTFPVQHSELTRSYFRQTAALVGGQLGEAMTRFSDNPADADALAMIRRHPSYAGSTGTTCVPTMLAGGHAENALPQSATATVNCRIFPGTGVTHTLDTLKALIDNTSIEWVTLDNPIESDPSPLRQDVFDAIGNGVRQSYPSLMVIPHMASGASDALHFRAVGIPSYTFSGIFAKSSDEFAHGLNERVPVATLPVAMTLWHTVLSELAQ